MPKYLEESEYYILKEIEDEGGEVSVDIINSNVLGYNAKRQIRDLITKGFIEPVKPEPIDDKGNAGYTKFRITVNGVIAVSEEEYKEKAR